MIAGGTPPPEPETPRRGMLAGVRGRLLALVVIAVIPIAGVAGANAWGSYLAALSQGLRDAVILREVAAARHGAAVDALKDMITGIARFTTLPDMPPEACDAELGRLRALKPDRYGNFWLLDTDGVVICSGIPTQRGRDLGGLGYVQRTRTTGEASVGRFLTGAVPDRTVLPAAAPMTGADGRLRAIVGGELFLDYFLRNERGSDVARLHHTWLLDQDGKTLPLGDAPATALPPADILAAMSETADGTRRGTSRDGVSYAWSIKELNPGLRLLVGVPMQEAEAAAMNALLRRAAELAIFLGACVLAIVVGVEYGVSRPLRRLAARVRRWAPGREFEPAPDAGGPREVRDLDRALMTAARALQERDAALTGALRQRDLLMAEIHHRVKNNLQVVASLLSLQSERLRSPSARAEFAVARDRVQALATLHRHLYLHQSFERISLRPFLEELSRQLGHALGAGEEDRISIVIEAEDVEIASDQAISLALLLTESVSNAIRHAFPDGREGTIAVTFTTEGDEAHLVVRDDGIGLEPSDAEVEPGDGLGLRLIEGFAAHLGGEAEVTTGQGTRISVRFPLLRRQVEDTPPQAA